MPTKKQHTEDDEPEKAPAVESDVVYDPVGYYPPKDNDIRSDEDTKKAEGRG